MYQSHPHLSLHLAYDRKERLQRAAGRARLRRQLREHQRERHRHSP